MTTSVPPIAFDHRPSYWLVGALLVAAALASVSLALSGLPVAVKFAVSLAAAGYFAVSMRRFLLHAPLRVVWQSNGNWRLIDRRGRAMDAALLRATVRGEWILIELRGTDRLRRAIVLAPDNSDPEIRRALRVRLARGMES